MERLTGKRLLVLGGTSAVLDVLRYARELGVYTIVTASGQILDEVAGACDELIHINTANTVELAEYIHSHNIAGIMTGASEFNIRQCIRTAEKAGIPFYATQAQWEMCANKASFKEMCRKNHIPTVEQFDSGKPELFQYPVIVKPVDSCSARGITVCSNEKEFETAKKKAHAYSASKRIIVEKYIGNRGVTVSARYILRDGEIFLEAVGDRWVLNPVQGKALITWAAQYPSKYSDYYIENLDESVKNMFKAAGLRNGCLFMESIPTDDGIFFYEMGYRISGGMTYKITEKITGINELKMLMRYTLTGEMCEKRDVEKIDPLLKGKATCTLAIPLEKGIISTVKGLERIMTLPEIVFTTQYYHNGDEITEEKIGTLDQLFARFTIVAENRDRLIGAVNNVNSLLSIIDTNGREMYIHRFNPNRFN